MNASGRVEDTRGPWMALRLTKPPFSPHPISSPITVRHNYESIGLHPARSSHPDVPANTNFTHFAGPPDTRTSPGSPTRLRNQAALQTRNSRSDRLPHSSL